MRPDVAQAVHLARVHDEPEVFARHHVVLEERVHDAQALAHGCRDGVSVLHGDVIAGVQANGRLDGLDGQVDGVAVLLFGVDGAESFQGVRSNDALVACASAHVVILSEGVGKVNDLANLPAKSISLRRI